MTLPPGGGATVRHPPAIAIAQLHAAGIELNASFPTAQSLGPFERTGELPMIFDGAPVLAEFGAAAIARAGGTILSCVATPIATNSEFVA